MKKLWIWFFVAGLVHASNATYLELAQHLEHGVELTADGRISDGIDELFAQGSGERKPKDSAERQNKFKSTLEDIRKLGAKRKVTRISIVFLADSYCRIRILDRRTGGAVLWTFIGEKDDDRWAVVSAGFSANEEFDEVVKELDANDYSREEPKQP